MVTINELLLKLKIYGPKNFIYYSFIESYRIILRTFNLSYSQFGEDIYINKLLNKQQITYVDVGANHPIKFNNTYLFYRHGGQGINIEPNPLFINNYQQIRPNDINLNIGLGLKNTTKTFYIINPDVNSTFSQQNVKKLIEQGCQLITQTPIHIDTLENIFKNYLKTNLVDIISLDTEGFDYQILLSNNWQKYRAKIIIIESNSPQTQKFLQNHKYTFIKKIGLNQIYIDSQQ